jgi:hypothetical protein
MIAADVGHAVGYSVYVATRFSMRKYKHLQPGFLLALLETKILRDWGFRLWDLGGVDSSPMMSYKLEVAQTELRPLFFDRFRRERDVGSGCAPPRITTFVGSLVQRIAETDLLDCGVDETKQVPVKKYQTARKPQKP